MTSHEDLAKNPVCDHITEEEAGNLRAHQWRKVACLGGMGGKYVSVQREVSEGRRNCRMILNNTQCRNATWDDALAFSEIEVLFKGKRGESSLRGPVQRIKTSKGGNYWF